MNRVKIKICNFRNIRNMFMSNLSLEAKNKTKKRTIKKIEFKIYRIKQIFLKRFMISIGKRKSLKIFFQDKIKKIFNKKAY